MNYNQFARTVDPGTSCTGSNRVPQAVVHLLVGGHFTHRGSWCVPVHRAANVTVHVCSLKLQQGGKKVLFLKKKNKQKKLTSMYSPLNW